MCKVCICISYTAIFSGYSSNDWKDADEEPNILEICQIRQLPIFHNRSRCLFTSVALDMKSRDKIGTDYNFYRKSIAVTTCEDDILKSMFEFFIDNPLLLTS